MAYRFEKNGDELDIVIDGWEKGIAPSAEAGIGDMRNVNIISIPKEVCVGFATTAVSTPSLYSGAYCTFNDVANTVTYTPITALYNGCSMKFDSTSGGVTQNVVYWVGQLSGSTFQLFDAPNSSNPTNLVNLTDNGSHVFTTITLGAMTQHTEDYVNNYNFFQDANGRVWWINGSSKLVHIGPLVTASGLELLTDAHGNGLTSFAGNGSDAFLFAFRDSAVDVLSVNVLSSTNTSTGAAGWVQTDFASGIVITYTGSHYAISGRDNAIYFANKTYIGRVLVGTGAFDPTVAVSYTATGTALTLPSTDRVTVLSELGLDLYIGGIINAVYIWNRTDTNFNNRLILSENKVSQMVSANSNIYIFAGNRGRIYITNGTNVQLHHKFPDQLSTTVDPYWTWGGAIYWKDQLYFGIQGASNDGVALNVTAGVWAIDIDSNALRETNILSYAGYSGSCPVIAPNIVSTTPAGAGFYAAWTFGSTFGLDTTSSTPYTSGVSYIDTDLIPVGTYFMNKTFKQIEFKLSKILITGESIEIQQRPYLGTSFSPITNGTFSTASILSGSVDVDFEKYQYLQLRIILTSTASSPSYVRLTEIRIR